MIKFTKLRYKNFLSSGNAFTAIDFDAAPTTLVIGHNGSGKSTMLDALSFGLFGKPHRKISKPQLVNSINQKGTEVEVEFNIGKAQYKIVRGIKPNIFEIWVDGNMVNQDSHAKEYQAMLEKNILKLSHKSFHQIVVLGSSSFVPFMQMAGGARREVARKTASPSHASWCTTVASCSNPRVMDVHSPIASSVVKTSPARLI